MIQYHMLILLNGQNTVQHMTKLTERSNNFQTAGHDNGNDNHATTVFTTYFIIMSDFYTNLGKTEMVPVFLATLTAWLTCDI